MTHRLGRRHFLHVGCIGGIGLTLADSFRIGERVADDMQRAVGVPGSATAAIGIVLPGGLAAQESFDPKPQAPAEFRGPFGTVATRVPGVRLGELWRHTARVVDKIAICRSVSHGEAAHEGARLRIFSGLRSILGWHCASLHCVSLRLGSSAAPEPGLPSLAYAPIPHHDLAAEGISSLSAHGVASPNGALVSVCSAPADYGRHGPRVFRGPPFMHALDAHVRAPAPRGAWESMGLLGTQAPTQAQSINAKVLQALQMEREEARICEEYGNTAAGAHLLLCRRLVEAGVRCVATHVGSWDMHNDIQRGMRSQVPPLDQAFASLIRDLDRRGLLDSTLVCMATEFGRSPKINSIGGREHWPRVFSLVLAGGGIRGGLVHGASDATGSEPSESPLPIEDWAATIGHCLGIPAESRQVPSSGPVSGVARPGQVRWALLA